MALCVTYHKYYLFIKGSRTRLISERLDQLDPEAVSTNAVMFH